ncbi:MarR family winged helix-turn-helix transcriptional regulator [Leifsonia sp. RAF41]|uniref:MarR family winged helix-turn-helix transcriptional regulator n=1 Tax=Leifsonia sp. RAF41 TaxID=3233056 RepID=UPI003F98C861
MTTDLEALGLTIKRAQYRNHRTMDAALRDVGISLVQWDALRAIDRMPAASGHDLAVATFQSDQAFGTLAGRLVERGLITRTSGRGRRLEHALTASGRTALDDGHRIAANVLRELFAPLGEAQRAALFDTLRVLTAGESFV